MSDTDIQLHEALTVQFVAIRGAVEALLNKVTAIVTAEQVERLKQQEQLEAVVVRLDGLAARLDALTQQLALREPGT